jgi:hypothetical protein
MAEFRVTPMLDPSHVVFEEVKIWEPYVAIVPIEDIAEGFSVQDRAFLQACYDFAKDFYRNVPPRRDGSQAFTHPTNVAMYLRLARCTAYVVAAGLLHDMLEEAVDNEKQSLKVTQGKDLSPLQADRLLDGYRAQFAEKIMRICRDTGFPRDLAERVVIIVEVLTRHKSDMYYKSIFCIFNDPDEAVRLGGVLVKLADRMHNIQTIGIYQDEEKIYQCFKNIFILNQAKQLWNTLRAMLLEAELTGRHTGYEGARKKVYSMEKLIKKCGKATFQALMRIDHPQNPSPKMFQLMTYLALALRKYILEEKGLWKVTSTKLQAGVQVQHLYDGIISKYDAKLHRKEARFRRQMEEELAFSRATFGELGLRDDELIEALHCKDAMALKEVVASFLYDKGFVISGFECSAMCRHGRDCLKALQERERLAH